MAATKPEKQSKLDSRVDDELDDIFAALGPEVTSIKVYRLEGGKQQALASYTPSQLATNPEEVIGGEFGPGQYLIRVVMPSRGGNRWGPSKTIVLAEDSQYVRDFLVKHSHDPEPRGADYSADPLYRIMELQIKMAEQRSLDNEKRLAEQNGRFHELILAMIQTKNGGSDIGSLIAGVKDLKTLSDGTGGSSRLTELKELIEIAALLKDGGSSEESPWGTLSKVLTAGLLGNARHQGASPAAAIPADLTNKVTIENNPPATTGAAIAAPTVETGDTGPQDAAPIVTTTKSEESTLADKLMTKAKAKRDPELWADWTLELADDEENAEAIALITSISQHADFDSWWKTLPETRAQRSWWETFFNRIREIVEQNVPERSGAAGAA